MAGDFGRIAKHQIKHTVALAGVSSTAFRMSEQLEANAPELFRGGWLTGKFHGEIPATTPIGR